MLVYHTVKINRVFNSQPKGPGVITKVRSKTKDKVMSYQAFVKASIRYWF